MVKPRGLEARITRGTSSGSYSDQLIQRLPALDIIPCLAADGLAVAGPDDQIVPDRDTPVDARQPIIVITLASGEFLITGIGDEEFVVRNPVDPQRHRRQ